MQKEHREKNREFETLSLKIQFSIHKMSSRSHLTAAKLCIFTKCSIYKKEIHSGRENTKEVNSEFETLLSLIQPVIHKKSSGNSQSTEIMHFY